MSEQDHAKEQAKAQIDSICEIMTAWELAKDEGEALWEGEQVDEDYLQERIQEDPLEVTVRSNWHSPGADKADYAEFNILLCTGGPACRIIGDLGPYCQPESADVEYQDWGTPWTKYRDTTQEQDELILEYCQQFCFEG